MLKNSVRQLKYEEIDVNDIKQRVDIIHLAGQLGIEVKKSFAVCPFHAEKTGSLKFYADTGTFNCFGCGEHGDQVDLYMKMTNCDFKTAIEELSGKTTTKVVHKQTTGDSAVYKKFHNECTELDKDCKTYLMGDKRGLTEAEINKRQMKMIKNIRFNPEYKKAGILGSFAKYKILIPYFEKGQIVYLKARALPQDNVKPKYMQLSGQGLRLYNIDILDNCKKGDKILLCEGEFDTMIACQYGETNAVGIAGANAMKDEYYDLLQDFIVCIAMDNDEAGKKAAKKIWQECFNRSIQAKIVTLPEGVKDVTEYYLKEK